MTEPEGAQVAEYLWHAVARTTDERSARVRYERRQEFAAAIESEPQQRQRGLLGAAREAIRGRARRFASVASSLTHLDGSGIVQFDSRRCWLEFNGLHIMLDGDKSFIGKPGHWEEERHVGEFLAVGGPYWLLALLTRTVHAEALDPPAEDELRGFLGRATSDERASRRAGGAKERTDDIEFFAWTDRRDRICRVSHSSRLIEGSATLELHEFGVAPPANAPG